MNTRIPDEWRDAGIVLAAFGDATLVKGESGLELRGGTMADRSEALEWVSLFMPEQAARIRFASTARPPPNP